MNGFYPIFIVGLEDRDGFGGILQIGAHSKTAQSDTRGRQPCLPRASGRWGARQYGAQWRRRHIAMPAKLQKGNFSTEGTLRACHYPGKDSLAAAGAVGVREPADVCLRRRGPWGGCVGRLSPGVGGRKACGVRLGGHFVVRTAAAPQALPEIPGRRFADQVGE